MSEKKMVSRNVAIGLGIICIILVVGLVGAFAYYIPILNDKNNTISSLNTQNSQLTTNNTNLQLWLADNITYYDSQISSLNSQIADLQNQKNQLQTWLNGNITSATNYVNDHGYTNEFVQNLQNQATSLQNQILSLDTQITNLQNQITSDTTTINSLTSQNSNLQSQYTTLQSNYSQLMQNYQTALAKIPTDKGIEIDGINYTAGSYGVTGVAIRNLGVNATTVVSLRLYWTNEGVLASSVSVDVVIPGNSTASIQTSLPINGWNTVYDTWVLKVQTLEGYNATSDPLMLIL